MGTLNVLVEISRVVGEMLSALKENDGSCCYGIRSEVRMVGECDIAERIKKKVLQGRPPLGHYRHFDFPLTQNTSHIEHDYLVSTMYM